MLARFTPPSIRAALAAATVTMIASACAAPEAETPAVVSQSAAAVSRSAPCAVDGPRELLITDPRVVGDAMARDGGPWSFEHLVTAMTPSGMTPSAFVLSWLEQWDSQASVNGFPVATTSEMRTQVICPWIIASGGSCDEKSFSATELDLRRAPFTLVAIVNRIDLRGTGRDRATAGEGRLVFGIAGRAFTTIFEYALPAGDDGVLGWATAWHDLTGAGDAKSFGPAYRAALAKLTEKFAGKNAFPGRPNGSALNQLRTNEIGIVPAWNLREFSLDRRGTLQITTTKQTPDGSLAASPALTSFLRTNRAGVISGDYEVPGAWLGGESFEPFFWNPGDLAASDEPLRKAFALNTCNGCHTSETNTGFFHVSPTGDVSTWLRDVDLPRRVTDLRGLVCEDAPDLERAALPRARVH